MGYAQQLDERSKALQKGLEALADQGNHARQVMTSLELGYQTFTAGILPIKNEVQGLVGRVAELSQALTYQSEVQRTMKENMEQFRKALGSGEARTTQHLQELKERVEEAEKREQTREARLLNVERQIGEILSHVQRLSQSPPQVNIQIWTWCRWNTPVNKFCKGGGPHWWVRWIREKGR